MEVEDIIQEIIEKEDEAIKQQQYTKNKEETRKSKESGVIKFLQYGLASGLGLLIIMMLLPWFNLGGSTTYEGFVRIPKNMLSDEYKNLDSEGRKDYEGVYIEASPVQLVSYVFQYFDGHSKVNVSNGKEKVSVFAWIHTIFIYGFILIIILAIVSGVLTFKPLELKAIKWVKYMGIFSLIIGLINILLLKITALNMIALNALNELRMNNGFEAVYLTQKGIAVKTDFYPYFMTPTLLSYIAIVLLFAWIAFAFTLERIKKNRSKELL